MISNKKRLAMAVAGALAAAPVAFAQAEVSIYGIADVSVTNLDVKQAGTKSFLASDAGSGGSRLGFNASSDLGGGLTAKANLEAGFDNSGAGNYATFFGMRQAWVGLSGGFGSITAGQDYSLTFLTAFRGEYCGFCGVASPAGLTSQGVRTANYLKYNSPDLGGLTIGVAQAFGEDATSGDDVGDGTELAVFYSAGPLNLAASTRTVKGAASNDATDNYIAGNYDFGGFKLFGLLGTNETDNSSVDESYTLLGASFKVGGNDLVVQFGQVEDDTGADSDTTMTAVSYWHALGKDTTLYLQVAEIDNDANASRNVFVGGGVDAAPAAGVDPSAFQIGVRYNF